VAFLSWPANHSMPGLFELLAPAQWIVYLGKNTDGSACGTPEFFSRMLYREVKFYVPEQPNSLIVYGSRLPQKRPPVGEERAAFNTKDVMTFQEAEKAVPVYMLGTAE